MKRKTRMKWNNKMQFILEMYDEIVKLDEKIKAQRYIIVAQNVFMVITFGAFMYVIVMFCWMIGG